MAASISEVIKSMKLRPSEAHADLYLPTYRPVEGDSCQGTQDLSKVYQTNKLSDGAEKPDNVLYLAYGSNLAAATFLGKRGIRPISAVNVVVPSLRLSFDIPGIPYSEPCFANSASRDKPGQNREMKTSAPDKLQPLSPPYHKDRWQKGLVGVVYELTPSDYAHVIATEGGGSSYKDVLVDCYEIPEGSSKVPETPNGEILRAHTLFAPRKSSPGSGGRLGRSDPSYAQPSARYLKLLTDGADEHKLPPDYKQYLSQIRPYNITHQRQRLGQYIFQSLWIPVVQGLFALMGMFSDEDGKAPMWLIKLASIIFQSLWASYDNFFCPIFGDGERTEEQKPDSEAHLSEHRKAERGGHDEGGLVVLDMV